MLRLAADENFNADIVRGLLRRLPDLDIVRVQDAGLSGADDRLMPERRDVWWDVDTSTDVASVGDQVATAVSDYVVPWFEKLTTRKDLIDAVEDRPRTLGIFPAQVPLILAMLAAEDGDLVRARSILVSALEDSRGKPFEQSVGRSPSASH